MSVYSVSQKRHEKEIVIKVYLFLPAMSPFLKTPFTTNQLHLRYNTKPLYFNDTINAYILHQAYILKELFDCFAITPTLYLPKLMPQRGTFKQYFMNC